MRSRLLWALLAVLLIGLDVYLLGWRLSDVQGNVEAQFIIVTPAFLVSHVLHRRRADRQHAERMADQAALHAKVDALHQHLGVEPAAD